MIDQAFFEKLQTASALELWEDLVARTEAFHVVGAVHAEKAANHAAILRLLPSAVDFRRTSAKLARIAVEVQGLRRDMDLLGDAVDLVRVALHNRVRL